MALFIAMSAIFATWVFLGALFLGLGGLLLQSAWGRRELAPAELPWIFWLGWALQIGVLGSLASLASRPGRRVGRFGGSFLAWLGQPPPRDEASVASALFEARAPGRGAGGGLPGESGLRPGLELGHLLLSSALGALDQGVSPHLGLGNVDSLLSYNSSQFLYVAVIDAWPWSGSGSHIANGLLLLPGWALLLAGIKSLFQASMERVRWPEIFTVLLAPALIIQAMGGDLSSVSPDLSLSGD